MHCQAVINISISQLGKFQGINYLAQDNIANKWKRQYSNISFMDHGQVDLSTIPGRKVLIQPFISELLKSYLQGSRDMTNFRWVYMSMTKVSLDYWSTLFLQWKCGFSFLTFPPCLKQGGHACGGPALWQEWKRFPECPGLCVFFDCFLLLPYWESLQKWFSILVT